MDTHFALLAVAGLLFVGLLTDELGRRTRLPRVTLLIVFGAVAGPSGGAILTDAFEPWYHFLSSIALTMVAFLLGGKLSLPKLKAHGKAIVVISLTVVGVTTLVVALGLVLIGTPLIVALLLAGIATATAPAATQDVVRQTHSDGPFTDMLLGIVAVDDAWGLIIFSLLLVTAQSIAGDGALDALWTGIWEFSISVGIGLGVGLPAAYLTGRLRPGEPTQLEALGLVFLVSGLSQWAGASFLLSGMVAGTLVVNLAAHHNRPFHEIEHFEWPFMVLFFVLAGTMLHLESLPGIGLLGLTYLLLRFVSRLSSGWIGGKMASLPDDQCRWIGLALTPQAGVALGMALVAANQFPEHAELLISLTIGTTIIFELSGPLLTQLSLQKMGETGKAPDLYTETEDIQKER